MYSRISSALVAGKLRPDDRIRIRDMAAELGTSVTPVRDAILRLVQDEALVMRSVRDIRVANLSLVEYLEIRDIRLDLEGMAAGRAAVQATHEDLEEMDRLIEQNEQAVRSGNVSDAIQMNQQFHFAYLRVANMPVLQRIIERLWLRMGPLIAQCYTHGGREMIDGHYALMKAMRRRDGEAAAAAVRDDILSGGQPILDFKMRQEELAEQRSRSVGRRLSGAEPPVTGAPRGA